MGKENRPATQIVDREIDPEVIKRRTELFNLYILPLKRMIYKLCINYSNKSEYVQENYNEVMINFYRRVETYNPKFPIHAWVHTCTKRLIWALENKRKREDNKNRDRSIEDFDEVVDNSDPTVNHLSDENYELYYNDDILALLGELKECYRDALLLQESGYTLKEIAEIQHKRGMLESKNIETVKGRLRHAKRYLKNNLNRDGERIHSKEDT